MSFLFFSLVENAEMGFFLYDMTVAASFLVECNFILLSLVIMVRMRCPHQHSSSSSACHCVHHIEDVPSARSPALVQDTWLITTKLKLISTDTGATNTNTPSASHLTFSSALPTETKI